MAAGHSAGRNAAQAGIVVMEVLLGVIVGIGTHTRRDVRVLDSRDVIGRV